MKDMKHDEKSVYLVTGATGGIGRAIAVQLATKGFRVLIGARSADSGRSAVSAIRSMLPEADLGVAAADLADMGQVRALAETVLEQEPRLDGLILNAAEVRSIRVLTADGFETAFATNYLSGFLLTQLLLPLLADSAPARIVTLSSSAHARVRSLELDALPTGEHYSHQTYPATKLLSVLFAAEFARRSGGLGVTANAVDPGFVRTNLGRNATGVFGLFLKVMRPLQIPPERAAATLVRLVTAPELADTNGRYFAKGRPATPSTLAQDEALAKSLWNRSIDLLTERDLVSREELTFLDRPRAVRQDPRGETEGQ